MHTTIWDHIGFYALIVLFSVLLITVFILVFNYFKNRRK